MANLAGVEVERPTDTAAADVGVDVTTMGGAGGKKRSMDDAGGVGRDAAGTTTAGSTDATAMSAGVVGMEVESSTGTAVKKARRRDKKQKRPGKKPGGKLKNETGFRSRQRDRRGGSGGGAGVHSAPST